jgi:hypothetical protein
MSQRAAKARKGAIHLKRPGGDPEDTPPSPRGWCGTKVGLWTEDPKECTCDGCLWSARQGGGRGPEGS